MAQTAEQKRLSKTTNGNGKTATATAAAQHPNKHIEAIANRTSDEFIEVAASLTRAKITEKLGVAEIGDGFLYLTSV